MMRKLNKILGIDDKSMTLETLVRAVQVAAAPGERWKSV
jgi:hypothetical protein